MEAALHISGLEKSFKETHVLKSVDFEEGRLIVSTQDDETFKSAEQELTGDEQGKSDCQDGNPTKRRDFVA